KQLHRRGEASRRHYRAARRPRLRESAGLSDQRAEARGTDRDQLDDPARGLLRRSRRRKPAWGSAGRGAGARFRQCRSLARRLRRGVHARNPFGQRRHFVRAVQPRMTAAGTAAVSESGARDTRRILVVRGLRAFGDGYVALLVPIYLLELGFSALEIGAIVTSTLIGTALVTLWAGMVANRYSVRRLLLAAALLMIATGAGFAMTTAFWPLLLI